VYKARVAGCVAVWVLDLAINVWWVRLPAAAHSGSNQQTCASVIS